MPTVGYRCADCGAANEIRILSLDLFTGDWQQCEACRSHQYVTTAAIVQKPHPETGGRWTTDDADDDG